MQAPAAVNLRARHGRIVGMLRLAVVACVLLLPALVAAQTRAAELGAEFGK